VPFKWTETKSRTRHVNFLAQNPKIPLSFHFEIPPVILSLKLNFFIFFSISKTPSQVARSDLHQPRRLQSRQQLGATHKLASPSGSHWSWEIVLTSPSGNHRNTPDRRYPSTIITRCKALTCRHLEHTSEAPHSEYLHRTTPEILHTMLIPRKP
jgi:hypothetical protein